VTHMVGMNQGHRVQDFLDDVIQRASLLIEGMRFEDGADAPYVAPTAAGPPTGGADADPAATAIAAAPMDVDGEALGSGSGRPLGLSLPPARPLRAPDRPPAPAIQQFPGPHGAPMFFADMSVSLPRGGGQPLVAMVPSERNGYLAWVSTTAPHPRLSGFISRFDGEIVLGVGGLSAHGMTPGQLQAMFQLPEEEGHPAAAAAAAGSGSGSAPRGPVTIHVRKMFPSAEAAAAWVQFLEVMMHAHTHAPLRTVTHCAR